MPGWFPIPHEADALGAMLRKRRKLAGLSQRELADRAGMGRAMVSLVESGGTGISTATLFRMLSALGWTIGCTELPGWRDERVAVLLNSPASDDLVGRKVRTLTRGR